MIKKMLPLMFTSGLFIINADAQKLKLVNTLSLDRHIFYSQGPSWYFSVYEHKGKLYILNADVPHEKLTLFTGNTSGKKMKHVPLTLPDSISKVSNTRCITVSDSEMVYVNNFRAYLFKKHRDKWEYNADLSRLKRDSVSLFSELFLQGGRYTFVKYNYNLPDLSENCFMFDYDFASGEKKNLQILPVTNTIYESLNHTFPITLNAGYIVFAEPHRNAITVKSRADGSQRVILLRKPYWSQAPDDTLHMLHKHYFSLLNMRVNPVVQASGYAFRFSSINKLMFINDTVLAVLHREPMLKNVFFDFYLVTGDTIRLLREDADIIKENPATGQRVECVNDCFYAGNGYYIIIEKNETVKKKTRKVGKTKLNGINVYVFKYEP